MQENVCPSACAHHSMISLSFVMDEKHCGNLLETKTKMIILRKHTKRSEQTGCTMPQFDRAASYIHILQNTANMSFWSWIFRFSLLCRPILYHLLINLFEFPGILRRGTFYWLNYYCFEMTESRTNCFPTQISSFGASFDSKQKCTSANLTFQTNRLRLRVRTRTRTRTT